jgi:enoyl-CoA hydratase/carnithine racemase
MTAGSKLEEPEVLDLVTVLQLRPLLKTKDAAEGMRAFMEKREAKSEGL